MKRKEKQSSLRTQLVTTVILCWVMPILLVAASGFFLLSRNYERSMRQELELAGDFAISQFATHFDAVIFDSKTVSYDGVVRSAYRAYSIDGDRAALYRSVSNYLKQNFARRESTDAAFLSFWELPGLLPYISNQGEDSSRAVLAAYAEIEPVILADMAEEDTKIRLYARNGALYAARNLLDSSMKPYATVVINCSIPYLTAPLASLNLISPAWGEIDSFSFSPEGSLLTAEKPETPFVFFREIEGHRISLHAAARDFDLVSATAELPILLIVISAMLLFLFYSILQVFRREVSRPVKTLVEANRRVESGDRGYQITQHAESREFAALYDHFNSMSGELHRQFNLALEEQQALHQARIKALQTQINPHFLNNTLEIINWESRIAGNDQITAMIEALATMLNTSLNRDDNPLISFEDELHYTEAYLYIIKQRMGDRLQVEYDIDSSLNAMTVPRMILQPLVENAIEHDLNRSFGGRLSIRAARREKEIRLRIEHNGHILPQDREKLNRLLQPEGCEALDRVHIGVRNVNQRIHLLYGEAADLRIDEISDGIICAEIRLPIV